MDHNSLNELSRAELIAEIDALRRQLSESKPIDPDTEKYRVLLDESSDPIFAFSPVGRYHYVNRAFAEGVGKPAEDIIGKNDLGCLLQRRGRQAFLQSLNGCFEHGSSRVIEVRVPRPGGDHYYVTTVKPILDVDAAVDYVICISKDITERKSMEEKLKRVAEYDSLTELPNRALFSDRLQNAIALARRDNLHLALMFVDLDDFKPINDTFGHHAGDLLLKAVAQAHARMHPRIGYGRDGSAAMNLSFCCQGLHKPKMPCPSQKKYARHSRCPLAFTVMAI